MAGVYEVDQVGKKQALYDIIANVIATETPFFSMLKKARKPEQIVMSYQGETYPNIGFNGVVDGTDVSTYTNQAPRYLVEAVGQLFRNPWQVTTIADKTVVAGLGGAGEVAKQKAACIINLKRMIERAFLGTQDCTLDDKNTTPYTTRGAFEWIKVAAQAVKPVPSALRNNTASIFTAALSTFTEAALKTMIAQAATEKNSAVSLTGIVGPLLKNAIDQFTVVSDAGASFATFPVRQFNQDGAGGQLVNAIDKLKFSEGEIDLMVSYHLARTAADGEATAYSGRSGLFVDMGMWDVAPMAMPEMKDLPNVGGGPRGYAEAILALRCYNPLGQMKVYTNS